MQVISGAIVASATDVSNFLECEHLTQLELAAAKGRLARPAEDDDEADVLRRRGAEHEQRYLQQLKRDGRQVVEIHSRSGQDPAARFREEHEATVAAMRAGADVIYQGTFFGDGWLGHADFLHRVERSSELGPFSYEVADTKLARHVKVGALLQMSSYSEQLTAVQGVTPERMHVVLGDMTTESHRLADYAAYYRAVKARFLDAVDAPTAGDATAIRTYPLPVDHCAVCRWKTCCEERWRADDHLSLVAGMGRDQVRKLTSAGIPTLADLARSAAGVSVKGIGDHTVERLRHQAQLQLQQRETNQVHYDVLPPDGADRGLCALPEPDPGDLFFDMEGDPWVGDDGLEYLFGVCELVPNVEAGGPQPDGSWLLKCEVPVYGPEGERYRREFPEFKPEYRAFWAHTANEEKAAFEAFIDFVIERLDRHPDLHIYHYAPYEPNRMKSLMGRYGTREDEVDQLLRGGVFVDLYQVVRQSIRISQESYSIKKLEPLYMDARQTEIKEGGSSIVYFERWIETQDEAILQAIQDYNLDDCVSTWRLRNWLEERRLEGAARFGELPRPSPRAMAPSEPQAEDQSRLAGLIADLTADVPEAVDDRTDQQQARWVLAQLLGWHKREDRPEWWAYFERLRKRDEELVDDSDSIGALSYEGVVDQVKQSLVHRYRFNPEQEHKMVEGGTPYDPRTEKPAGTIVAVDNVQGIIDLKRGRNSQTPHPTSLVPQPPINNSVLRAGIERCAAWILDHGLGSAGAYEAVSRLLCRIPPQIDAGSGGALQGNDESGHDAALRLALRLDGHCLPIQGPPGSGKTYTAARMIVDLIKSGKRIGLTAPTHKAIGNLLEALCRASDDAGLTLRAIQKAGEGEQCATDVVDCTESNAVIDGCLATHAVDVVAGTPWLFARPQMDAKFDVLFVDEAGQMALANVVAMGGCTRNIVLLGDPQQLPQVTKGVHPAGTAGSALEHILNGHPTIPPEAGIFLGTTWRLHPAICQFVSEIAYEGRLEATPACAMQSVQTKTGHLDWFEEENDDALLPEVVVPPLQFLSVVHAGNRTSSNEEVSVVADAMDVLATAQWTDASGGIRPLGLSDVLFVAPYNAQVAKLGHSLPEGARVGTVDKIQGQEAAVVVYSLATSSADDLPRHFGFLFSINRLNVAISRARGLAVLVCSPTLLSVRCRTPEQMRQANGICRFVELAGGWKPLHLPSEVEAELQAERAAWAEHDSHVVQQ